MALAEAAVQAGWDVTLLLGPVALLPGGEVSVKRFTTCEELRTLLREEAPRANVLVMAAAVADYRPKPNPHHPAMSGGKFRRTSEAMTLELEPTPDLLAEASGRKKPGQYFVGFALEPREELLASAEAKLVRKRVDMVVANPLETMDSPNVEATILLAKEGTADGSRVTNPGMMSKAAFATWLVKLIGERASLGTS